MYTRKLVSVIAIAGLVTVGSYAKNDKHDKTNPLPYGLQKKVANGKQLPQGWQKKLKKGEVVDQVVLSHAQIVISPTFPDIRNTKVYQVNERIFRISQDTKEILEILK